MRSIDLPLSASASFLDSEGMEHTVTRYCPSNEPTTRPANTTTSVSTNAASDRTNGTRPDNLYFMMTLFGVLGGEGSALYVDRRWSPRSGSIDIFSSQKTRGGCGTVLMVDSIIVCECTTPDAKRCHPRDRNAAWNASRVALAIPLRACVSQPRRTCTQQ